MKIIASRCENLERYSHYLTCSGWNSETCILENVVDESRRVLRLQRGISTSTASAVENAPGKAVCGIPCHLGNHQSWACSSRPVQPNLRLDQRSCIRGVYVYLEKLAGSYCCVKVGITLLRCVPHTQYGQAAARSSLSGRNYGNIRNVP